MCPAMSGITSDLRVGVIGVGTMGQHHARILCESAGTHMVGFYDPDPARSEQICERLGCGCFSSLDELLDRAEAVSVAAPTSLHLEIGEKCLQRGIHVLIEKPLAHDVPSATKLVELARKAGVTLMVGHVERYNPAIRKLMELLQEEPEEIISIDARRLAPFDGSRCMDVDVLYDLLIHDVDLALEIAGSSVRRVSGTGKPVFSQQTDVAHTRIEFANGTTAVFWTGKCSPRKVRSLTVTTPRRHLEADTLACTLTVCRAEQIPSATAGVCFMGEISSGSVPVDKEEPLRSEIEDFLRAVRYGLPPLVDGARAVRDMQALELIARSISQGGTVVEADSGD